LVYKPGATADELYGKWIMTDDTSVVIANQMQLSKHAKHESFDNLILPLLHGKLYQSKGIH
jgi:hypothetical protein